MSRRKVETLPLMPTRLKELRLEMGWSLEEVAHVAGVTHRSVAGNWEATNERRRTPDLGVLQILQKWYGASLDYMAGNLDAERDSPAVKLGKKALVKALKARNDLAELPAKDRAQLAVRAALEVAPEAFFEDRLAAFLAMDRDELAETLENAFWTSKLIERVSLFLGLDREWFYDPNPAEVLKLRE